MNKPLYLLFVLLFLISCGNSSKEQKNNTPKITKQKKTNIVYDVPTLNKKLRELKRIHDLLESKRQKAQEHKQTFLSEINDLQNKIVKRMEEQGWDSIEVAKNDLAISLDLKSITNKYAYYKKMQELDIALEKGVLETNYTISSFNDKLRIINDFDDDELKKMITNVDDLVRVYMPQTKNLALNIKDINIPSTDEVWKSISSILQEKQLKRQRVIDSIANEKQNEKNIFNQAKTIEDYQNYITQFENGIFVEQAYKEIEILEKKEKIIAQEEALRKKEINLNEQIKKEKRDLELKKKQKQEELIAKQNSLKEKNKRKKQAKLQALKEQQKRQGLRGTFTDNRDGQEYEWVKIGTQIWMAENMNYFFSYATENKNIEIYGLLYSYEDACSVCPKGWHLPTKEEWETLANYIAIRFNLKKSNNTWKGVGRYLKSYDNWGKGQGLDYFGFTALPAGFTHNNDKYSDEGYWWIYSSSSYGYFYILERTNNLHYYYDYNRRYEKFSVRCVKD